MGGLITDNSTISMKFANAMKDFLKKAHPQKGYYMIEIKRFEIRAQRYSNKSD